MFKKLPVAAFFFASLIKSENVRSTWWRKASFFRGGLAYDNSHTSKISNCVRKHGNGKSFGQIPSIIIIDFWWTQYQWLATIWKHILSSSRIVHKAIESRTFSGASDTQDTDTQTYPHTIQHTHSHTITYTHTHF